MRLGHPPPHSQSFDNASVHALITERVYLERCQASVHALITERVNASVHALITERVYLESLLMSGPTRALIRGMHIWTWMEWKLSGEVDEGIAGEAPRPMDPIMVVMVILWRVEGILKEADTRMRDGDETSRWQLTDARPSLATLRQARQVLLTRIKRCSNGNRLSTLCRRCTAPGSCHCHVGREEIQCWMCNDHMNQATSTVPERWILVDALICNLLKIGTSLIEKVVDVRPHPESISRTTQDRVQFKAHIKGWKGVAERRKWTGPLVKCGKEELTDEV